MKRYDSYKDSGVEWIGEIPSSWKKLKIKHLFSHTKGKNGQKLTKEFIGNNPGEYPVYSGTTKGEGHLGKTNEYEFDTQEKEVIFVSTVGSDTTVMSTKVLKGKFNLSQNCLIMTPIFDFSSRYQYYFTTHDFPYQRTVLPIVLKEGHRSVGMGELNEFTSLLPPLFEQQQIVSFLDTKTSLIDSLIEKTQLKIELLKEKRTSLINEVVTKGLNPNVEMKDSGVEWIGEIPNHWEIIKGKYILKILTGNYPSEIVEDEDGQYFVKVDDLNSMEDNFYLSNPKLKIQDFGMETLEEGIILFPKRGMTIFTNKVVITKSRCFIDPNLMGIRVFDSFNKIFLFYLLTNRGLGDICDSSTIPQINNKHIYPLEFTNPPINEQQQIVSYLDEQTQLIDNTMSIEEKRIELLKEYRQSLISNVVTGKIKVCN